MISVFAKTFTTATRTDLSPAAHDQDAKRKRAEDEFRHWAPDVWARHAKTEQRS